MKGSFDAHPEAAPLLSDQEWKRLRLIRHLVGTGRFAADIGAASPYLGVRELKQRGVGFDPAEASSA